MNVLFSCESYLQFISGSIFEAMKCDNVKFQANISVDSFPAKMGFTILVQHPAALYVFFNCQVVKISIM